MGATTSGDAGTSLGAALTYFYDYKKNVRNIIPEDSMKSLLGYSKLFLIKEISNIRNLNMINYMIR